MFRRRNSVASAGKVSCLIPFTMMFNQRVQEIVVVYTYTRRGLLSLNFITIGFGAPIHFVTIDDNSVCIGIYYTNIHLLRYCHTRNKDNTTLGLTSCTAYVDGIITSRIQLCIRVFEALHGIDHFSPCGCGGGDLEIRQHLWRVCLLRVPTLRYFLLSVNIGILDTIFHTKYIKRTRFRNIFR